MVNSSRILWSNKQSGHRIAIIAWLVGVALLPWHYFDLPWQYADSCEVSGGLGLVGLVCAIISIVAEMWFAPYRRWSFALFVAGGFALLLLTGMSVH